MGRGRSQKTLDLVQAAHDILEEIQPASVRAVCYQLFTRGLIASMTKNDTNRVSDILARAREHGEIDWEWIIQEGRAIESDPTWDDPADYARSVQSWYKRNKWNGQPKQIMLVSEKGTVRGTLQPVIDEFDLSFLPVGGYGSTTHVNDLKNLAEAKSLLLLYLGDHDPSGRAMSDDDIPRRLAAYITDPTSKAQLTVAHAKRILRDHGAEVRRIALTEADTRRLGPALAFPASDKRKDPRYASFVRQFGEWCWELDAMNPNDLRRRVRRAIMAELDREAWDRYVAAEEAERQSITRTIKAWNRISGLASE